MDKDEIRKRWQQQEVDQKRIHAQRKYKNASEAFEALKNDKIEYEEFEDAIIGMEDLRKISDKEREKWLNKAEELTSGDEDIDKQIDDLHKAISKKSKKTRLKNFLKGK